MVKHIKFQKELYPTGRFPHVFTKLHAVGMEKYDKVIVLDTDVLIRNDMDEPFERQTPAAVRRHLHQLVEDRGYQGGAITHVIHGFIFAPHRFESFYTPLFNLLMVMPAVI